MTKLKWRPISSAPINEKVLVAALGVENTGWIIETMIHHCIAYRSDSFGTPKCPRGKNCEIGWASGFMTLRVPALYWMPLPDPPKPKEKVTR